MKFTISTCASTNGTVSFSPISTAAATSVVVTDEQLAATWNRPLAQIQARMQTLNANPTEKAKEKFCRWLIANGTNPELRRRYFSNIQGD